MSQSGVMASDGQSAAAVLDSKGSEGNHLRRCRRASRFVRTAALRAGLTVCLAGLAGAAPQAVWCLNAVTSARIHRGAGTASAHATPARAATALMLPLSADALYRRQELQYRKVEFDILRKRYAELQRRGHRRRRHRVGLHLLYPFVQQQYWAATLAVESAAVNIDLSGLPSDDGSAAATETTSDIFPDPATPSALQQNGSSNSGDDGSTAGTDTGTLTLSGGSIHDTDKMTVDAGGTLPLFTSPDWSFNAKFDDAFTPNENKVGAGGIFELFATPDWSFTAKFDGEFSPQPQLYAGSGTLRHTW